MLLIIESLYSGFVQYFQDRIIDSCLNVSTE